MAAQTITSNITLIRSFDPLSDIQKPDLVDFLYTHLEQYGDAKKDIQSAINYAIKESESPGGFLLVYREGKQIAGAVVINKTGMIGYIPENILVYIAVDKQFRGQGIGKKLMKAAVENAEGDVALHVEPDNPARFLYEKIGFTSKYLEMRYKQP